MDSWKGGRRQNEGWSPQTEQRTVFLSWSELAAQLRPQHLQPPGADPGCHTTDGVTLKLLEPGPSSPGSSTVPKSMFGQEYTM